MATSLIGKAFARCLCIASTPSHNGLSYIGPPMRQGGSIRSFASSALHCTVPIGSGQRHKISHRA